MEQQLLAQLLQASGAAFGPQQLAQGRDRLGAQAEFSDQAKAAPAAAKQPHQVVAGHVFNHPAPGLGARAIGAEQGNADDLVAQVEVAVAQATAEPPGHQAPDAAGPRQGWVNGQPLVFFGQGRLQIS